MNNDVRDGWGELIGFRCFRCEEVRSKMWGTICNQCRADDERHAEILAAHHNQKG